jgi:RNA methyltransferase, TrmH family
MTSILSRLPLISHRHHPAIKRIRSLQTRAARERTGTFFIDGMRFVGQALKHHVPIETLVVAPDLLLHPFGQKLAQQQQRAGTACLAVTPDVYYSLSQAEEPQGIGAVVRQRWEPLNRIDPSEGPCWVVAEAVQTPGNLGTMIRTCDAVGAGGVILLSRETDPYHPGAVRATMGSLFSQRFVRTSLPELMTWKQRHHCMLVGTSPTAAMEYQAVRYHSPVLVLMGGEREGLSRDYQALCDVMVKIPMVGGCDSLNLAIATSVMLYEVFNQRRAAGTGPATPGPAPPVGPGERR